MPYTIIMMAWRKPGLTPAEYRHHYETSHVPLIYRLAGDVAPSKYTRNYVSRSAEEPFNANALIGEPSDFSMDSITTLSFKDEAAFQAFFGKMMEPSIREEIAADEEKFLDRPKLKLAIVEREEDVK